MNRKSIILDDKIKNKGKKLNELLMNIDIKGNIHQQAIKIGYFNIYTEEDIEKEIKYNLKYYGGI